MVTHRIAAAPGANRIVAQPVGRPGPPGPPGEDASGFASAMWFDGEPSNGMAITDSDELTPTESLSLRVACSSDSWTPPHIGTIAAQYKGTADRAWRLVVNTTGAIWFQTSQTGQGLTNAPASSPVNGIHGSLVALRVEWFATQEVWIMSKPTTAETAVDDLASDDGWTHLDPSPWTGAEGVDVTVPALFNSSAGFSLGGCDDNANTTLAGTVLAARLIVDGEVRAAPDLRRPFTTRTRDEVGKIWTHIGEGGGWVAAPRYVDAGEQIVAGQTVDIMVPDHPNGRIVIYVHGMGEDHTAPRRKSEKQPSMNMLLQAGYIVAASAGFDPNMGAGGNSSTWGNAAGVAAYQSLHDYLVANHRHDRVIWWAVSMGGMVSLNTLLRSDVQNDGWYGIQPATNLAAIYASQFEPWIESAYGFDGPEGYAAATTGFDPCARPGSDYDGWRMRFIASPDDTGVKKADNTNVLAALVDGHAIESDVIAASGDHGDLSHFRARDLLAFAERC